MTTNTIFSFKRLLLLAKHHLVIDRRSSLLKISGFFISIVLVLFIGQFMGHNYLTWNNNTYFGIFVFFYFVGGILYAASSFKWLRSKESRYTYLMVPATSFEKYLFEFIIRILAYVILVPFLYWFLANLEGTIFKMFVPEFKNFQFSFWDSMSNTDLGDTDFWENLSSINGILICFILPFAGVTFFKKSPFPKLLLSQAIISTALFLFGLILFKVLGIEEHHAENIFSGNKENFFKIFSGIALLVTNITALIVGYYNVKEKEV